MTDFEDSEPQKSSISTVTVGEDLSRLSEDELEKRIEALAAEIRRTEETLSQRAEIRDAADAFFKK